MFSNPRYDMVYAICLVSAYPGRTECRHSKEQKKRLFRHRRSHKRRHFHDTEQLPAQYQYLSTVLESEQNGKVILSTPYSIYCTCTANRTNPSLARRLSLSQHLLVGYPPPHRTIHVSYQETLPFALSLSLSTLSLQLYISSGITASVATNSTYV